MHASSAFCRKGKQATADNPPKPQFPNFSISRFPFNLPSVKITTCFFGWPAVLVMLAVFSPVFLRSQCTMVCENLVNVSLDQNGQATITPEIVAQNPYNPNNCQPTGPQFFEVTVMTSGGQTIPTSPVVSCQNLGATLTVKVKHLPSGNSCWGNIHVEDKLPPVFACLDKTVSCNTADLAPTNPVVGQPTVADNCDVNVSRSFSDSFTDVPCGQLVNGLILSTYLTRNWTAVDDSGNSSTCVQHIYLEKKSLADIVWPADLDDVAAPSLNCVNPNSTPTNTGKPQIDARPIDGFCELSYNFQDQNLPMCGSAKKILRTWTVLEWCNNAIATHLQIIEINDFTPPVFACPADFTVNTNFNDCLATVNFPAIPVSDDCSPTVSVKITSAVGSVSGNGGTLAGIPIGSHSIVYEAKDLCGNTKTCSLVLKIEDQIPPNVICRAALVVGLNNTGTANVPAKNIDNGSFDNCTAAAALVFLGKKMQDTAFSQKIKFDCSHVGTPQTVILRVLDAAGNENECMATVDVQDKLPPTLVCPADQTVNCDIFSISNLAQHGAATALDNCSAVVLEEIAPIINLSSCNAGTVLRRFRATDAGSFSSNCTQKLTVVNNQAWNGAANITWPTDFTKNGCATNPTSLAPDSLPVGSNFPKFQGQNACNTVAYSFSDEVFQIAPPACFKIFRKWKVVDWCVYNTNLPNGAGQWTHFQTITVMDNQPPVFQNPPAEITVSLGDDCKTTVNLPVLTAIDCAPNPTITVSSSLGVGFGPFQNVSAGEFLANYKATDGCGNVAIHHLKITVADKKTPTAICHNGLTINLMATGTTSIWAKDFDVASTDNCTAAADLKFSFSQNILETGKNFDCQNLGTNVVDVWVTDAAGNGAFCSTYILVQDPSGACSQPTATVAGAISTPAAKKLAGVTLRLDGTNALPPLVTDTTGSFAFPGLPVNIPYTLTPEKTGDWLNGITTYDLLLMSRHILGVTEFISPFTIIAADVNGSKSVTTNDIVILRKLILGIIDTLPVGKSWRFVDAAFPFSDPKNPFASPFPESKYFAPLQPSGGLADFTAIKIGDTNGNASTSFSTSTDDRDEVAPLVFFIENQQVRAGERVAVRVRAENLEGIEGYQFSLNFDAEALAADSVSGFDLENLTAANFNFLKEKSTVVGNWENPSGETYLVENQIFTINFTAKKDGQIVDFLDLKNENLEGNFSKKHLPKSESYRAGKVAPLEFRMIENEKSEAGISMPKIEMEISPNPVFEKVQVSIFSKNEKPFSEKTAFLTVADLSGKIIFEKTLSIENGSQSVEIQRDEFPGGGVFVCRMEIGGEVLSKKIVVF